MTGFIVHSLPGRLKLKIMTIKYSRERAAAISEHLMELPGIINIDIKPLTGSLIIEYQKKIVNEQAITGHLESDGITLDQDTSSLKRPARKTVEKVSTKIGQAVFSTIMGKVLEKTGLGLLAVFI